MDRNEDMVEAQPSERPPANAREADRTHWEQADRGQSFSRDQLAPRFVKRFDKRCPVDDPTLLAGNETVTRQGCDAVSERWCFCNEGLE
jgi:hypothetical protein